MVNNKKTILFINTIKGWGGGEHWHLEWAMRLNSDYNVFIIANKNSKLSQKAKENKLNIKEINISNFSIFNPIKWVYFCKIINEINPDTAIINLSRQLKIFAPLLKINKTKKVIYAKGSPTKVRNNFINKYILTNFVSDMLCNSVATATNSFKQFPKDLFLNKIHIIYHCLDIENYDKINVEIKHKINNNKLIIKSLGRISPEKNQIIFIELAKELINKNINFEISIGGDGIDFNKLKDLIIENNLQNHIKLNGFITDTKQFLSDGDLFILPSKWEGFGLVKLEAMALSLPIIAFNNSSNPETIIENQTGYLIPNNDIQEMANKIELLFKNSELKQQLGENNRKLLEEKFNLNVIEQKIINLIN